MAHYLDARQFTRLFKRDRLGRLYNRRRIAAGLHLIAQHSGQSRRFIPLLSGLRQVGGSPDHELEDAVAAATLLAIRKIDRFNPRRRRANAFSYFTTVILRGIARELERAGDRRARLTSADAAEITYWMERGRGRRQNRPLAATHANV